MLHKLAIITLAAISAFSGASALPKKVNNMQEVAAVRMPAIFTTATSVVITTTTVTVTVATTCAQLVSVTGACRRRRGVREEPILVPLLEDLDEPVNPSPVELVERTAEATLNQNGEAVSIDSLLEASKLRTVDVDVIGLPSNCFVAPRNAGFAQSLLVSLSSALASFTQVGSGLIINFTTSQTATFTSTVTVSSGTKSFVISLCTPPGFLYRTC